MSIRRASVSAAIAMIAAAAGQAAAEASAAGVLVLRGGNSSGAVVITGNGDVQTTNLTVNSSSRRAVIGQGNATLRCDALSVVGGADFGGAFTSSAAPVRMALPTVDPHAARVFPMPEGRGSDVKISDQSRTLEPGTYREIKVSSHATLTLKPGVYHITDGLDISGHASVIGEGVTIFIHDGEFSTSGHCTVRLTAPQDGGTAGFTIVQPRWNDEEMRLTGGSSVHIAGTIYAPAAEIAMHGQADADASTPLFGEGVICDQLVVSTGRSVRTGVPAASVLPLRTIRPPSVSGLAD